MNGPELLRIIDAMHREKSIPKEVIFGGIESALQLAAQRSADEEDDVLVHIDRMSGHIIAQKGDQPIDPEMLGRIAAQSAKQVMIQKIREAESEGVYTEFQARKGEMVTGTVQRVDAGTVIVTVSKDGKNAGGAIEAILPRSEQIPGETPHVNDRVKAVVMDVRRNGHRVKIVLSRCHPDFVRSLFEQEIPEIADRTIEIKAVAREAGYRSKVAVSSIDLKVDCVGACVGVRGSRIKNVIDELNGERIDICAAWRRFHAGHDPQCPAAGGNQRSDALLDAWPGGCPRGRGPALARHRPARAKRSPGQQARRLGHRNHDPRRARRKRRKGRTLVLGDARLVVQEV